MKTPSFLRFAPVVAAFILHPSSFILSLNAASTIDAVDKYAYGANIGWINWRHDQPAAGDGAVIGLKFCSGYVYSANCGWISLGDGSPDDGIAYSNSSATDCGVNVASIDTFAGEAVLAGYAYGANIGWINFEQVHGQPKIDTATGAFSGYAYSANCGWINLANGGGVNPLATDTIDEGADSDADMIPDWWELDRVTAAGLIPVDLSHLGATTDGDGDGESDLDEFAADTDPFDADDALRIVTWSVTPTPPDNVSLFWTSKTTRLYDVEVSAALPAFALLPGGEDLPGTGGVVGGTESLDLGLFPSFFARIVAKPPLGP